MIEPRVVAAVDIELRSEGQLVLRVLCTLINQRTLLAAERCAGQVGLEEILTKLWAKSLEEKAQMCRNGIVAQNAVTALQEIPGSQQGERDGNQQTPVEVVVLRAEADEDQR